MKNKVALISGGMGDIGRATALAFGKRGVRVAISDLLEEAQAQGQLALLKEQGCTDILYKKVDVTSEKEVIQWMEQVESQWGPAQIIVPNAGIVVTGSLSSEDLETVQVKQQMDVNYWGSYYMAVHAARRLKSAGLPGRIVFIGSWVADRPTVRIAPYCISKAAVRMLCKTLALDLAETGILVNEIAPGIVEGGLSKKNQAKDAELRKRHLESIPVHQLISVEEIARHILYLCEFGALNITGTTLLVDGGLSLTSKMTP